MKAQDRLNERMEKRARSKKIGITFAMSPESKSKRADELQADIYMRQSCAIRKRKAGR